MRQRVLLGSGIIGVTVIGVGVVVWAGQQGYLGPYGKARRLLGLARQALAHERLPDAQANLEELVGTFPSSPWADDALLLLGGVYERQQQHVEARRMYQLLLEQFPSSPVVTETQDRLGRVSIAILFSPVVTELDAVYEVRRGDTLGEIAQAHRTTVELIKRANSLKANTIFPRQKLKIPTGRFRIVVDKSQNRLLLTEDDQFVKSYPVATGKDDSTPVGTFTIVNKVPDPVWYRQGAVVPPDSPENILGTRWMGLDEAGYGIHGSTDPAVIGQQVTAGCVRMTNADVEELFAIVPIGTEVTIVN